MSSKSNLICIWSGPASLLFFFAAIISAHFLPPTQPSLGAEEIASLYRTHLAGIRLGAILFTFAPALMLLFFAVISAHMKRMEGAFSPLSYAQLVAGAFGAIPFVVIPMIWTAAAFRVERAPQITQALNDLGWTFVVQPSPPVVIQLLTIGFAILGDRNEPAIFPRWVAFLNFWVAILLLPGLLMGFFKNGPFAWNGLLAFWLPAVVFGTWMMVMTATLLRAEKARR